MSITLVTYPGASWSNSYATVAESDTLVLDLPDDSATWLALSSTAKALRLFMAAPKIGMWFSLRGFKAYDKQALAFPRKDDLGYSVDYATPITIIPYEVKLAQVYIAYAIEHRALAMRPGITEDAETKDVIRWSMSGFSIQFGDGPAGGSDPIQQYIKNAHGFLQGLLSRFICEVKGGPVRVRAYEPAITTTTSTTTTSTTSTSTTSTSTTSTTT